MQAASRIRSRKKARLPGTITIPEKTYIGPHEVKVKLGRLDKEDCHGLYVDLQIALNEEDLYTMQLHSYLHELVHAIEDIYGFALTEQKVDCLAAGLAQALTNGRGHVK